MQNNLKELVGTIVSFYIPNVYTEILPNKGNEEDEKRDIQGNHQKLEKNSLVFALDGCTLTIQYIENHSPNIIVIHLCSLQIERIGSLFSLTELKFFDLLGFELTKQYQNLTGLRIDDWWDK